VIALELLAEQVGHFVEGESGCADLECTGRELRQVAAALRTSGQHLQAILDNMVDGVFVCDATGRLTLINEAGFGLIGLPPGEIQRPVEEIATLLRARHPDGSAFTLDDLPLVRALRGEVLSSIDLTVTDPRTDCDVHLRVNAAPLQDERGAIVGAVSAASNVTEMVELQRLKDEFLRVAAHELKTPVAIVKGYSETLLRMTKDLPPAQRRMFEALVRGADRIDRIASDLLLLQQLRAGRLELVFEDQIDLAELAEAAARHLEPDAEARRISIAARRPAIVRGDRQLLRQVLSNLMANALRYSPDGGPVEVVVDTDGALDAVLSVEDHGVGIAREKQPRIFEPFYRAHTDTQYDFGGMGAGLYLAKAIVKRHGGTITFTSEEGQGSTFTFRLPFNGADRPRPASRSTCR
jgi:two-component system sensor histidine kinase VicK